MKFLDLLAYQKSFSMAMKIFETTKSFIKEETYSLTDQIWRSSKSVPITNAEGHRKRIYPKHFCSKLTYSDGENSETQVCLEFAVSFKYISDAIYQEFSSEFLEIRKCIYYLILKPEEFGVKKE
jgi:four helix bundle protein